MSYLVVEPYLIELVRKMDAEGFSLTVAGGLGLYLKHRWVEHEVVQHGRTNLFVTMPRARPTADIDAFLALSVFLAPPEEGVSRFRQALADLDYEVHDAAPYFQFIKAVGPRTIKLDLHARLPRPGESGVKYKPPRIGRKQQPPLPLHAYGTPESFAIEERPLRVPLVGNDPDGQPFAGTVQVPHPFAALCMKIKAALDHEQAPAATRKPVNQRHAYDVFLLLAMLDREEFGETQVMTETFAAHPELAIIAAGVSQIFGSAEASGCRTIELQARALDEPAPDLRRFSTLLGELFLRA